MIKGIKVSLLAVDESHCVSEWGASFRPEYLKGKRLRPSTCIALFASR